MKTALLLLLIISFICCFSQKTANIVSKKRGFKYGLVNTKEKEITPFIYDSLGCFQFCVDTTLFIETYQNGRVGMLFFDKLEHLRKTIKCKYDSSFLSSNRNYIYLVKNGKCTQFDYNGQKRATFSFKFIQQNLYGDILIKNSKKWSLLAGDKIQKLKIDDAYCISRNSYFVENFAIKIDGKWGVWGRDICFSVPCKYDTIVAFRHSCLISGKYNGKWDLIDIDCNSWLPQTTMIISQTDTIIEIKRIFLATGGGIAKYKKEGKWGVINKVKGICTPYVYDEIRENWWENGSENSEDGDFLKKVRIGEKWGVLDISENKFLFPCEYDSIYTTCGSNCAGDGFDASNNKYMQHFMYAKKEGEWHFYDLEGNIICNWLISERLNIYIDVEEHLKECIKICHQREEGR